MVLHLLATHLCKSLKERQVEPFEICKGLDAAHHIPVRHLRHTGVEVRRHLLEHLRLVEIQLALMGQKRNVLLRRKQTHWP